MQTTDSLCPAPALLARLQANALPAAEAAELRTHIARCQACQTLLASGLTAPADAPRQDTAVDPRPAPAVPPAASYPFLDPPQGPDEIGRLGGYRVLRVLGEGGMGIVFEAEDEDLQRRVALKVLRPELADESFRQRFLREARAAAGLPPDHIATVYRVGRDGDTPFLAMELLQGESLEARLQRDGWLPLAEALAITRQVAEGLGAAHERNLIHRDIKPANLWLEGPPHPPAPSPTPGRGGERQRGALSPLSPGGGRGVGGEGVRVKVLDFGLARPLHAATTLTAHGQVMGTPSYMAPEQAYGLPVDARADLYSLGCVLYRMLTGQAPFTGPDTLAMLAAATEQEPRPAEELSPNLPRPVALLLHQLLARDPDQRPAGARSLIERLLVLERGGSPSVAGPPALVAALNSQPKSLQSKARVGLGVWAGALVVLAALAAGAYVGYARLAAPGGPPEAVSSKAGIQPEPQGPGAGPAGDAIKVGILQSLTGTLAVSERPLVEATQLAIDEVNQSGGVLGRRVEPITEDGGSDEEVFAQQARRLLEKDRVVVIFGCWGSGSRKRVAEVCRAHDRLLLYPVPYEGLEESPNVFYLGGSPNHLLLPVARWAYADLGKRRFFLVGSETVFSRASHAILADELKRLGASFAGESYAPLDETDFSAAVNRIKESKADIVLNTVDGHSNLALRQALRKGGIRPPQVPTVWFNVSEHELHYLGVTGKGMVGDYAAWGYFQGLDTPANRQFVRRFRARYGPTRSVNDPMQTAYCAVYLWKQAVEEAGTTGTAAVRAALQHQQIDGPGGLIRIDPDTQHAWRMARIGQVVAGGQFKVVWQSPEPLPPQPFPPSRTRQQWQTFLDDLYREWGGAWEKHGH